MIKIPVNKMMKKDEVLKMFSIFPPALCLLFTDKSSGGRGSVNDEHRILRLEDLDLSNMQQSWGEPRAAKTVLDKPLKVHGKVYEHGVGTHAFSIITIDLKGAALSIKAMGGVDEEILEKIDENMAGKSRVRFLVFVDRKPAYEGDTICVFDEPCEIDVDLKGAERLDLVVENVEFSLDFDHADWLDAFFILDPESSLVPASLPRPDTPSMGILTPKQPDSPRINAPGHIGAGANREFLYYVPVAGKKPMNIDVKGLPDGLRFNSGKGVIEGESGNPAEYELEIEAENSAGRDKKTIRLSVGSGLAKTPPMGWNSWNCWGTSVDEDKIKAAAEVMVSSGLIDHGWTYVNIDDAWQGERDPETKKISPNDKFPDMKKLADFIHSKGLKFGVYSDVGPKTCAGYEGSKDYECRDAHTYAEWGVDYVKVDWCHSEGLDPEKAYGIFGKALAKCGRDIVYSICNWGYKNPWEWGAKVGGNLWRTTGDIFDAWASVHLLASMQAPLYPFAGPGHWNDPDMLVVGKLGWGPVIRDTRLTPNQQYSHMTYWALLSAPLILGCDLTQLDDFTMNLLTNDEVIAVNQDNLGRQARRLIKEDGIEVWVKDLSDGSKAIGVFNITYYLGEKPYRDYTLDWSSIGLAKVQHVRDLWRQKDLGVYEGSFPVSLPEFGVIMIKVNPE
mgnify:CR=1 FL=1